MRRIGLLLLVCLTFAQPALAQTPTPAPSPSAVGAQSSTPTTTAAPLRIPGADANNVISFETILPDFSAVVVLEETAKQAISGLDVAAWFVRGPTTDLPQITV